ncbi:MAG: hypothetical protein FI736_06225 [SAR202 cluster bacterium]|nr:hypothetical protein [SAR202 cluster bacterium]|tara:strand:+ start:29 stop:532 length:504 start_codon:yes stop_codon:yes gene_type:complete
MQLIEIAQLVTGVATLIVASVLIWQMIIQKRTLDIAHNDADSSMSLTAVENKINLNTWFSTNSSIEMIEKMDKSLESLNPKEKDILSSYAFGHVLLLITEWRLGRMNQNPIYFRNQIRSLFERKAVRELMLEKRANMGETVTKGGVMSIMDEVYEEITGEKLPVLKN